MFGSAYQLRFDAIRKKIEFEKVTELIPSFYKRRTKEHQVGDLKSIERHTKKTELTKVLTWLARYGNDETVYWLESKIPTDEDSKQKFYSAILRCISKFGFNRLMRLALSRREAVFGEYVSRGKITFDSLTFSGRSRIKRPIVDARRNETVSLTTTSRFLGTGLMTAIVAIARIRCAFRSSITVLTIVPCRDIVTEPIHPIQW